ncbi:hypothetical protein ABZZ79_35190 [Streptomyces sp. NPDC006458]|uniref:hypothetical protein n=1 Tax=Streptomyces sp. NPDC006458 TaxID=3154302 RepID=UPI0033B72EE6
MGAVAWFLFLILLAVVLGLVGAVVQGLTYLLAIGAVVFGAALVLALARLRRTGRRPVR